MTSDHESDQVVSDDLDDPPRRPAMEIRLFRGQEWERGRKAGFAEGLSEGRMQQLEIQAAAEEKLEARETQLEALLNKARDEGYAAGMKQERERWEDWFEESFKECPSELLNDRVNKSC